MTSKRFRVLSFIISYLKKNKIPPTLEDIRKGLGYKSNSAPRLHLRALSREGFIRWSGYRNLVILSKGFLIMKRYKTSAAVVFTNGDVELPNVNEDNINDFVSYINGSFTREEKQLEQGIIAVIEVIENLDQEKKFKTFIKFDLTPDEKKFLTAGFKRIQVIADKMAYT